MAANLDGLQQRLNTVVIRRSEFTRPLMQENLHIAAANGVVAHLLKEFKTEKVVHERLLPVGA